MHYLYQSERNRNDNNNEKALTPVTLLSRICAKNNKHMNVEIILRRDNSIVH